MAVIASFTAREGPIPARLAMQTRTVCARKIKLEALEALKAMLARPPRHEYNNPGDEAVTCGRLDQHPQPFYSGYRLVESYFTY
jgi:hypothetical protein